MIVCLTGNTEKLDRGTQMRMRTIVLNSETRTQILTMTPGNPGSPMSPFAPRWPYTTHQSRKRKLSPAYLCPGRVARHLRKLLQTLAFQRLWMRSTGIKPWEHHSGVRFPPITGHSVLHKFYEVRLSMLQWLATDTQFTSVIMKGEKKLKTVFESIPRKLYCSHTTFFTHNQQESRYARNQE